jgi:hypothetical protein
MSTALCVFAALALPSSEPSAGGRSMQPEALPAELKVMLDDFDARLDPAREIQLENKCNMGARCPLPRPPMAWVASKKVGVCACAKCGTTALYNGIYKGVYGHQKTWGGDVQRLFVPEWHNFFAQDGAPRDFFVSGFDDKGNYKNGTHDGHAMAFVREPISRLVSAWKDKFSCGLYVPAGKESTGRKKGDGGWFEASNDPERRRQNIKFLTALTPWPSYEGSTKVSDTCPSHDYVSPNSVTTFNSNCTYVNCLGLDHFADLLLTVHKRGLQDDLNAHIKPQSRECFGGGASPDKWDTVSTGYDKAAIKKLGQLLDAHISLDDDGAATKQGQAHSTADAVYDGKKFMVPSDVFYKLKAITREEEKMLHKYYEGTEAMLMGKGFDRFKEGGAGPKKVDVGQVGSWRPAAEAAPPGAEVR